MWVRRALAGAMVVLAVMPVASFAFDDDRRGLVLGGGLGLSPITRWSAESDGESMVGFGLHFFVGYAWDACNMIGYENNAAVYSSDYFNTDSLIGSGDMLTKQGFQGASWYRYWGRPDSGFFTVGGLGLCEFDRGEGFRCDMGGAYLLGAGCLFARHLQGGLYFSAGRSSDEGRDFSHRHLSLLVSYMGF